MNFPSYLIKRDIHFMCSKRFPPLFSDRKSREDIWKTSFNWSLLNLKGLPQTATYIVEQGFGREKG